MATRPPPIQITLPTPNGDEQHQQRPPEQQPPPSGGGGGDDMAPSIVVTSPVSSSDKDLGGTAKNFSTTTSFESTAAAASGQVKVLVDGEEVAFDHEDAGGTGTVVCGGGGQLQVGWSSKNRFYSFHLLRTNLR